MPLDMLALVGGRPVPGVPQITYTSLEWAWIGAACFAVGALVFIGLGFLTTLRSRPSVVIHLFVVLTAMVSYLAAAMSQGTQLPRHLPPDPSALFKPFTYARFVDWSITTPLLLLGLALLALPEARKRYGLVLGLMGADLLMIVTGIWAGLSPDNPGVVAKYIWFFVSCGAFLAVYGLIWGPLRGEAKKQGEQGARLLQSSSRHDRYMGTVHQGETKLFYTMAAALSIIWLIYPINFLLSPQGWNIWSFTSTSIVYTISDITAKVIYGGAQLAAIVAIGRRAKRHLADGDDPDAAALDYSYRHEDEIHKEVTAMDGSTNGRDNRAESAPERPRQEVAEESEEVRVRRRREP